MIYGARLRCSGATTGEHVNTTGCSCDLFDCGVVGLE